VIGGGERKHIDVGVDKKKKKEKDIKG